MTPLCPDPTTLQSFVEGRLDLAGRRSLREHALGCATCLATIARVDRKDPTGGASSLRRPAVPGAPVSQRFEILRRLGAGGMGVVYEARNRPGGERVALKTVRDPSPDAVLRFKNEFRALQGLQHENLASLHELIEEDGQWFFTMDLIDGPDLLSYLRRPAEPQETEERLRDALSQLARGLLYLHGAGKVHRDIKPHNVLVTAAGRVVLLDFGLVADEAWDRAASDSAVVGTVAYMAPEQAAGRAVGPGADWYSVGVLLYEALTGQLPISGAEREVLTRKLQEPPARPGVLVPGVPADLDDLCADLLRTDPSARPCGTEVLQRLRASAPPLPRAIAPSVFTDFVGREAELRTLTAAYEEAQKGRTVAVLVHGESGQGKSSLLREVAARLRAREPRLVVLASRCYEREWVPYKALDGILDAVSRLLHRLPEAEVAALLPRRAALLARVFPVLGRVAAFATAPQMEADEEQDPIERQVRLFAAVRELLCRLADRRPLVLIIDDLQWADADSIGLLEVALRGPDAPALLLIGSRRGAPPQGDGMWGRMRPLPLGPLPQEEARTLALRLIEQFRRQFRQAGQAGRNGENGQTEQDGAAEAPDAALLTCEAEGHPLFLLELVRHSLLKGLLRPSGQPVRLDEVLWARIAGLGPCALRLLQVLAVAGAPLVPEILRRAVGAGAADLAAALGLLRQAMLIRATGAHGDEAVETYHDRVREAVIAHLAPAVRRERHAALAGALLSFGGASAEELAVHLQGAGQERRAAQHVAQAAAEAEEALAFERAARLYRLALDLGPWPGEERHRLLLQLGRALGNAGQGCESAAAYLTAAADAGPGEAIELRQRAGQLFFLSGRLTEATAVIGEVLAAVGLPPVPAPRWALCSLLLRRAWLRLRGLRPRPPGPVKEAARRRIDTCLAIGSMLLHFGRQLQGADYLTRGLLLALDAGDPFAVARGLCTEAFIAEASGARERADRLLGQAEGLLAAVTDPQERALGLGERALACSNVAYLRGQWRRCSGFALLAEQSLRGGGAGTAVARSWALMNLIIAQAFMGEVAELQRRVPLLMEEARQRGDCSLQMALIITSGVPLTQDDTATLREQIAKARQDATLSGIPSCRLLFVHVEARTDLYEGQGYAAWRRLQAASREAQRSRVWGISPNRVQHLSMRGGAALSAALSRPARCAGLLRAAERDAKRLLREGLPWATALGQLLHAGVLAGRGRTGDAVSGLAAVAASFDDVSMALHAACARRREGELRGGAGGAALVAAADDWMEAQGVRDPRRMTAATCPGFAPS